MGEFGTDWLVTLMQILILTGAFACAMAFHNVAMRYGYALGREGILPKALGRTHPKHRSPHIASFVQTAIAIALVLADRKSTRLNSSHANISYAVFCLKKKIR